MEIKIPRITRPVELTGYAPELADENGEPERVHVWVNPTRDLLHQHAALLGEAQTREQMAKKISTGKASKRERKIIGDAGIVQQSNLAMATWYATVWSQHADPATHWTPEQVLALANLDTDPGLYVWLTRQTWQKITEHRSADRKN